MSLREGDASKKRFKFVFLSLLILSLSANCCCCCCCCSMHQVTPKVPVPKRKKIKYSHVKFLSFSASSYSAAVFSDSFLQCLATLNRLPFSSEQTNKHANTHRERERKRRVVCSSSSYRKGMQLIPVKFLSLLPEIT